MELWSWPIAMIGVKLQWTFFIESANKPVFVDLQKTLICSNIEKAQNTIGKEFICVKMNACVQFSTLIYWIPFVNISNFVWNLILHLLKYVQYQWTNNDIPFSFTVAFHGGKWIMCFVTYIIIESWVCPPRDWTSHGIA